MKRVLVFRTSLQRESQVRELSPELDRLVGDGGRWNFDLEDRDRILRVETPALPGSAIAGVLFTAGHSCEELED